MGVYFIKLFLTISTGLEHIMRRSLLLFTLVFMNSVSYPIEEKTFHLSPLPPRNPTNTALWEKYSQDTLKKIFVTQKLLSIKPIFIEKSEDRFARNYPLQISISTGLLEEFRNENEYIALLIHESGHTFWQHQKFGTAISLASSLSSTKMSVVDDLQEIRIAEAEADFFSVAVTGNLKSTREMLGRRLEPDKKNPFLWLEKEQKKIDLFRLQTLKNMSHSAEFRPMVPSDPLPTPLPNWNSGGDVWKKYMTEVLRAMHPSYRGMLSRLNINLVQNGALGKGEWLEGSYSPKITLNIRILPEAVKTSEELATLLGHEFGHTVAGRDYAYDYLNVDFSFNEIEVERRVQGEADLFAMLPLQNGVCIWSRVFDRAIKLEVRESKLDGRDYSPELDSLRLERLKRMCKSN